MEKIVNKIIEIDKKAQELDIEFDREILSIQKSQKDTLRQIEEQHKSESITKLNSIYEEIINSHNDHIQREKEKVEKTKMQVKKIFEENKVSLVNEFFNKITE